MIWHHASSFSGCCGECKRFHALSYRSEDEDYDGDVEDDEIDDDIEDDEDEIDDDIEDDEDG